jgi:hypothetical protein
MSIDRTFRCHRLFRLHERAMLVRVVEPAAPDDRGHTTETALVRVAMFFLPALIYLNPENAIF